MARKNTELKSVRSVERFHHFRCAYCSGWWGIGDAPERRKKWYCAWCGKENFFKKANYLKYNPNIK